MARLLFYADGDVGLTGELFEPETPNNRAILVVHEADGIGGNVRRRCALLADLGYVALAADLHGAGAPLKGAAMQRAVQAFRDDPARLRRRTAAGLAALSEATGLPPSSLAAIGYCFGGTAVLELARDGAAIAGVASFHGLLTTKAPAGADAIRTKVAAFTGALDPLVPPADVAAFQAEMGAARADWQLTVYGNAWHSFSNIGVIGSDDPRMRYDAVADRLSWDAALAFLDTAFAGMQ